jgi:hypothetical protein
MDKEDGGGLGAGTPSARWRASVQASAKPPGKRGKWGRKPQGARQYSDIVGVVD